MSIFYFPFCCYDENILNKSNLGKMEFIFTIRLGHNLPLRKVKAQGKKKQELEVETMTECLFLAHSMTGSIVHA